MTACGVPMPPLQLYMYADEQISAVGTCSKAQAVIGSSRKGTEYLSYLLPKGRYKNGERQNT